MEGTASGAHHLQVQSYTDVSKEHARPSLFFFLVLICILPNGYNTSNVNDGWPQTPDRQKVFSFEKKGGIIIARHHSSSCPPDMLMTTRSKFRTTTRGIEPSWYDAHTQAHTKT